MTKISVLPTATAAYEFTIGNYAKLLGVVWAPLSLIALLTIWQILPLTTAMQQANAAKNPFASLPLLGRLFLLEGVAVVLLIVVLVGITKVALGRSVRWPLFYLAFGGDFWRLLLATVLISLIGIVAAFGISIVVGIAIGIVAAAGSLGSGQTAANPAVALSTLAIVICIYGALLFIGIRLGFFLPSIVIMEKNLGLGRNWTLTRGNFWRIFALVIATLLPMIVLVTLQYFLMASFEGFSARAIADPSANARIVGFYMQYWYIYFPASLLLGPIFYGPLLGASAATYRTLAPDAADQAGVF